MKTNLLTIPYVGKETKKSLKKMGITCVEDLVGKDPEQLYLLECEIENCHIDRCQLYMFRMAVYYAEHTTWDEDKLKWWYWKDKEYHNKNL